MGNIKSDERFVRWQTNLRNQVSFTNNLLLTISIGICGFFFNLLTQENFKITIENKSRLCYGLFLLIMSILVGILTGLSRIIDFRLTLNKINKGLETTNDIDNLKYWSKTFGKITWFLFYSQILLLFVSLLFLFKTFYSIYLK